MIRKKNKRKLPIVLDGWLCKFNDSLQKSFTHIDISKDTRHTHRFFSSSLTKDHRLAETISYDRSRSRKNEYLISFSSQLNGNKNKTKCCFESLTKTKALSVFFFNRTSYNKQNMKNY